MKPLVTIAIPTCNRSALLRETLQSVLLQDYENLEILVSDNASDDDTSAVVAEFSRVSPKIRHRRNLVRTPLITHFNQCIAEARGEFFVLLSDDDRISEDFVSSLATTLMQNRRITVAVPSNSIIDDSGKLLETLPSPGKELYVGVDFAIDWLWRRCDLPVANLVTVMARTDQVRQLRYQPFSHGLNSDNLLFLQLALTGLVAFPSSGTFFWRVHDAQAGSRVSPRNIRRAGREFQRFIRRDWALRRLILSHHPQQQVLLRRGVDRMIAEAYLHNIGFFDAPYSPKTVRKLLTLRPSRYFIRLVIREYYNRIRNQRSNRTMSPANV